MPLANGSSQETISANIAQLIGEGYPRDEAAAIAYSHAGKDEALSAQVADRNGFITIDDNPISKVGVFEYSGAQINHPDQSRWGEVFRIYRPADELANEECINSFKLVPFIDEHAMLGPEERGATPAEKKGVQGVIGEKVYFDGTYLRGNLKMFAEAIKGAVKNGKKDLSPGYTASYELTPGVFEGQNYDGIQRNIRGNHLALVREGRTGPDISVMDHMTFTVDAKEFGQMADENTEPTGATERIKALLDELKPLLAEQSDVAAMLAELGIAPAPVVPDVEDEETVVTPDPDPAAVTADAEGIEKLQGTMDEVLKLVKDHGKRLAAVESSTATMDQRLVTSVAERDELASKVTHFVGTFDAKGMTTQGVAQYAVEQLGIPAAKGGEVAALNAWMHGRTPAHKQKLINTMDSKGATAGDDSLTAAWEKQ